MAEAARKKKHNIVFIIAMVVFVASLVGLAVLGVNYLMGQNKYEKISRAVLPVSDFSNTLDLNSFYVDWDALWEINPDAAAWIVVPGTSISYPVVYPPDNDHYVKTDFEGETNWMVSYGAIFMDASSKRDFSSANTFVFGHNMNNGAMFHDLELCDDQEFFDNNRTIFILTPTMNYHFSTFALLHTSANARIVQPDPATPQEQEAYIAERIQDAVVVATQDMPAASEVKHSVVLTTCDNKPSDGRYLLFASEIERAVPLPRFASDMYGSTKLDPNSVILDKENVY